MPTPSPSVPPAEDFSRAPARVREGLVDYNVLVTAEQARFRSDFSGSHWLFQVISIYEGGIRNDRRRDAFERVLRVAGKFGTGEARKLAEEFPVAARFPKFEELGGDDPQWEEVKTGILANFPSHVRNRFHHLYRHEGD